MRIGGGALVRGMGAALAVVLVLVLWLTAVPLASAATTVGQLFTPTFEGASGCNPGTYLQTGVGSGGSYTIPVSGTIDSWSFETNKMVVPGLKLKVGRPTEAGKYTIVGEATAGTQVPDAINTFAAGIPVQAGDVIGIYENGGGCFSATESEADTYAWVVAEDELTGKTETYESLKEGRISLSVNVVAQPTSTLVVPLCSQAGTFTGSVSTDSATSAKAIRFKVDGGAEQSATTGSGGSVSLTVPAGSHTLEYWGEDALGQQGQRHTVSVVVDSTPPTVSITSDQHTSSYLAGAAGSVTTLASDAGSGLAVGPSGGGQVIATAHAGKFSVSRSATDKCGNVGMASFGYTVEPVDSKLAVSHSAFHAARRGPSILAGKGGTVIGYTASDAGTTAFVVFKAMVGTRHGSSCVKRRSGHAGGRRCTLYVKVRGGFVHNDLAGKNTLHFTGRLGGRALAVGTYRLALTPTAVGIMGPTVNVGFRIAS